jgi:hypothetical protein
MLTRGLAGKYYQTYPWKGFPNGATTDDWLPTIDTRSLTPNHRELTARHFQLPHSFAASRLFPSLRPEVETWRPQRWTLSESG